MAKVEIEHKDLLGRVLSVGDVVAMASSNTMYVGTVDKLNPKMVKVKMLGRGWTNNKYSSDLVKIEGPEVTMYILKKA